MRRYDTFTLKAKTAFIYTLSRAEEKGKYHFVCTTPKFSLQCKECPFRVEHLDGSFCKQDKTVSEWLAWAGEEIEEDNNDEKTAM